MKGLIFVLSLGASFRLLAQEITFTNRVVTFTNLEGRVYKNVILVKGDSDGLIWRDAGGGGRVSYTNLALAHLTAWEIPIERIETARLRAGEKADAERKRRAAAIAQANAAALAQAQQQASIQAIAALSSTDGSIIGVVSNRTSKKIRVWIAAGATIQVTRAESAAYTEGYHEGALGTKRQNLEEDRHTIELKWVKTSD